MKLLLTVEQSEGVLHADRNRTEAVEASKGTLDGVLDEGLTARPEFHQDVIRTGLDAHDLGDAVAYLEDLCQP